MTPPVPGVDPGLLRRFRAAATEIAWREAPGRSKPPRGRRVRFARLHDEEARVESWGTDRSGGLEVDSGPVGALVLVLEADRRGSLPALRAVGAPDAPAFLGGAIRARWGKATVADRGELRLLDLVELARYALV